MHIKVYLYTHTHIHTYTYKNTYIHIYIYIYIYIHRHIHVHTYIHTVCYLEETKLLTYELPKYFNERIIVCVSNPAKVIIRLDKLRQFLKECKYPEYVISKSIFNAKLQGSAPNPERSKNVISFVLTYYPNIDIKPLMQTVKNKFKNIWNEHLRSIYQDTNFALSLKQPKNLHRELTSSRFILSSSKNIRKQGTYNARDAKYVKIISIKPINSQFQMVKFGKFAEKLTATQTMSSNF